LSRERIRQVASRSISRLIRRTRITGHDNSVILEFRYPPEADSDQLAWLLTIETCATGTTRIAKELAYRKLRIAGHPDEDARNIAARVAHHVARLSKHIARTRKKRDDDERGATRVG